jgi:hypothetical protein
VTAALDRAVAQVVDFISGKCLSELWNDCLIFWKMHVRKYPMNHCFTRYNVFEEMWYLA